MRVMCKYDNKKACPLRDSVQFFVTQNSQYRKCERVGGQAPWWPHRTAWRYNVWVNVGLEMEAPRDRCWTFDAQVAKASGNQHWRWSYRRCKFTRVGCFVQWPVIYLFFYLFHFIYVENGDMFRCHSVRSRVSCTCTHLYAHMNTHHTRAHTGTHKHTHAGEQTRRQTNK